MIQVIINKIINWFKKPEEFNPEKWAGLLWIWEKDTDYKFWWDDLIYQKILNSKTNNRQVVYEYNQWAEYETRNWCTIYSAVTEVSYLMDHKFADCEIKEIWHKMIADWKLDPNGWAYLSDAIDYVRRYWNKHNPDNTISSYRIDYTDLHLRRLLKNEKLKMTQLGYRTSRELYKDCMDDWIAIKDKYPKEWWHAVSKWWVWIIDNYKWKHPRNRYNFKKFDELITNWIIFRNGYVFLRDND